MRTEKFITVLFICQAKPVLSALKRHLLKRLVANVIKFGVSLGIIAYLVIDARNNEAFAQLAHQPKHWGLLGLASLACLGAVMLTFVRWHVLVRALDLPFSLRDAFRLGFLGYLLNFVSFGSVGGDLFKAVFIARQLPGRRPEAVATVVLDRVIGLYMLFVMASVASLLTGQWNANDETVRIICRAALMCSAGGAAGILALLVPGFTFGNFSALLARMPRVGPVFGKLLGAIRIYRSRMGMLWLSAALSTAVHSLTTLSIYLVARGLPGEYPSLADHFVIVPLAMVTGVLPLPVNGLGALEMVIKFLYDHVPVGVAISEGHGFIVAIGYRAVTILIAMIGVCYYLSSRAEVSKVLREAEREIDEAEAPGSVGQPDVGTSFSRPELGVPNC